ncbi:MAG: endolytic transglycosylase MltG [Lachnospiraceae bacterium]|nr:endolytic transglycosylase MltG [Lachnospiraceae bacterium]
MKIRILDVTVSFIGTIIRAVVLIGCIILVSTIGKKAYDFGFRVFTEGPVAEAPGRDIVVSVDKGEGLRDIAKKLEEKGITSDWALFFVQAKLSEHKGEIDPGTYTLNNSMTTDEMMAILVKADENEEDDEEYKPEGLDSAPDVTYDINAPVESGSELIEGDMQEGETPYEGEDESVEYEEDTGTGEEEEAWGGEGDDIPEDGGDQ